MHKVHYLAALVHINALAVDRADADDSQHQPIIRIRDLERWHVQYRPVSMERRIMLGEMLDVLHGQTLPDKVRARVALRCLQPLWKAVLKQAVDFRL